MEKTQGNIIKSSFLTNNIIYIFSDSNWVALIHTTQFQFPKQDHEILNFEPKTRMLSKEEVEPQTAEISISYEGPSKPCQVQIYENGIVSLRKNNILLERLQTWNEYLDDLIEKNQWEKAMHQGMLIYQGQIKILSEIASSLSARQEQMSQMFQKIAFTHIMFALKPLDVPLSQQEKENKIKKTIEFLLRVDNMTYALVVLKDFFKDIQQMKLYFTCLDPFIKNKQIAVIPESFFVDYVSFYQNEKEMIQQLVLQLDLHQQEPTLLIKVCMDYHLYKAMIYLCIIYFQTKFKFQDLGNILAIKMYKINQCLQLAILLLIRSYKQLCQQRELQVDNIQRKLVMLHQDFQTDKNVISNSFLKNKNEID